MARMLQVAAALLLATLHGTSGAQQTCVAELGAPPCEGGSDPGSTPAAGRESAHVGNPFDAISGNKYQSATDFLDPGTALAFVRHYNSALADRNDGLGRGWRHGYAVELARLAGGGYAVRQADGRAIEFVAAGEPVAGGRRHAAREASDGWLEVTDRHVWTLPDGRRLVFSGPFLATIDYSDGRRLNIERDGARVLGVVDGNGRRLSFLYAAGQPGLARYGEAVQVPSGHLERLILPNGDSLDYRYDAALQLVSVTDARGRGARYGYAQGERDERAGLLASVHDEATDYRGRWRYEGDRAVEWFDPDSGDGVVIANRSAGPAGGSLEAHRADGAVDLLTWTYDPAHPSRPRVDRRRVPDASSPARWAKLPTARALDATTSSVEAADRPVADASIVERFDASGLIETERELVRHGRRVAVRAFRDRLGTLQDLEVRGLRASDLARELAAGASGACTGAPYGACLDRARELVEIAIELDDRLAPPPLSRRGRQHLPGGPACPLPAYVDCAELAHQREMAMLSSCAYTAGACTTGYREVTPASIGLTEQDMTIGSFHAQLYVDPTTGNHVLAFRGTDDLPDWGDNGRNAVGLNSAQYAQAVKLVERLAQMLDINAPGSELELTGHSLGGGLATLAAVTIDRPATVFNAAAVHPDTARWNRQDLASAGYLVDAVRLEGEPVSSGQRLGGIVNFLAEQVFGAQEHLFVGDAPGQRHDIPQPDEPWIVAYMAARGVGRSVALHSIDAVMRSLELLFDAHCSP